MNSVAAAGFDTVRIPITWMGHIGPAPDYLIEAAWLKRVAEIVGYAHTAGLRVIINIHHDGHTESGGKNTGWLAINKAVASKYYKQQITAELKALWTQIALHFINYGDYLIFESMNEIHDGGWGWGNNQSAQYPILNEWNQAFVDVVRKTGGNNVKRFLLIPGYCTVPKLTIENMVLPQDPENTGSNKFIVSVHYYDPSDYAINGNGSWSANTGTAAVQNIFNQLKNKFINAHIPVIIGEYGAVYQSGGESARLEYMSTVTRIAHEKGLVPIYWDNGNNDTTGDGEKFGLFNRANGAQVAHAVAVIETMMEAVE
jgi:endoglucanase